MVARSNAFETHFGFMLSDISRLARKEFDRRVRDLELTRAQWLVLMHLTRRSGCTQSDLAESMQMQKITVSRHVGKLVRAGWVERRDHQADRRAYRLYVASKAGPLIDRLTGVADRLRDEYMRGVSGTRRTALMADLVRIKSNLLRMEESVKRGSHDKN